MQKSEIILQVAAAGGKITLYGLRTLDSWLFSCDVIDQSAALINEPTIEQRSDIVDSWPAALQLINHYQWHRLLPVVVHEAFRREVFGAVQSRFHLDGRVSVQRMSDWEALCNG